MTLGYVNRFFDEPKKSYFLFGPRGTGKSTLAQNRHPHALTIDLRLPEVKLRLATNPEYLLELVRAQPPCKVVTIDEI